MSPGSVLPIVPGDRVLDLCGAPGGKATQLGMRLMGSGVLFANDISASRAQAMLKNIELAGIPNVYVTAETPEHLAENFPEYFDKILVDAPCSGEGMFRREPSMVKDWEAKGPAYYADIQQQILRTAVRMLRPGGMLLYSTCTFSTEEDEENVRKLLAQDPALSLVPIAPRPGFSDGKIPGTVKLWPHKIHGEGHFLSLFQKAEGSDSKEAAASKSAKCSASKPGRLPEEAAAFLARLPEKYRKLTFLQVKENIYLLPEDTALRPGLHYLRTGLFFGALKKEHFTPSQALALAASGMRFVGVAGAHGKTSTSGMLAIALSALLLNALSRPDFVAYNIADPRGYAPAVQRRVYRTPMAAWTVRTQEQLALAKKRGDMVIFEKIRP